MKKQIKMFVMECDICAKQEQYGRNIFFSIGSDICDECFFNNGASIDNFEFHEKKWVIKKSINLGAFNE